MRGGGDLLPGLAGEHRPAAGGKGQGLAQRAGGHGLPPGWCGVAGVAAAVGLGAELVGQGGQDAGLVFGLGGDQGRGAGGLQVQHRPQLGCDVQPVQAQVVGGPAGAEAGGQVPVAGPVDLLDPGPQPGDRFRTVGGRQLPPRRCWPGAVTVGVRAGLAGYGELGERGSVLSYDAAEGGGLVGELGQAGVEPGELLGLGGELVGDGGDRVVAGHPQLQGKSVVPSPRSHSAGT